MFILLFISCFGLSRLYIVDTERQHESTRELTLAGDNVLCTFIIYQHLELPETVS
jgi:hypothetical protein